MLKTLSQSFSRAGKIMLTTLILTVPYLSFGQNGITVYQYRYVPPDKVDEFINRETTYWSEVAKNAIDKGNLTFWALLEKVGGYDLGNSSNYLFINTYNDVDKAGDVWDPTSTFPNVSMDIMETNTISTTTSMFFMKSQDWAQAENAKPDDFRYLSMIYHNASTPADLIALEKKYWAPFIKSAMDGNQTKQVAWGNALVLSPTGPDIGFNTVSYDLYPSLQEALIPTWDENIVFPEDGLTEIGKNETGPRSSVVYRVVKAVSME